MKQGGRRVLSVFILLISAICITAYLLLPQILVRGISASCGLDISYRRLAMKGAGDFLFTGLTVMDRRSSVGFFSQDGRVALLWDARSPAEAAAVFDLNGVRFLKKDAGVQRYDDLNGLVSAPFDSQWTYGTIRGRVERLKYGLRVDNFDAVSDYIRLVLSGDLRAGNTIDAAITIHFSRALTSRIPEALSGAVLRDEPDGWKSLAVKMKGNYKKPSIEVTGKLFRLNVKEVSAGE